MNPRDHAISVEAKKHAYRQTQDGVVVSFVVQPNDIDPALAAAPLGTRYTLALVEMNDEGEPVSRAVPTTERRSWGQLTNAQQAGIRCNDPRFVAWVAEQSKQDPAEFVRAFCGVRSRADINEGAAADRWRELDARFLAADQLTVAG